jgi:hypothetical protein
VSLETSEIIWVRAPERGESAGREGRERRRRERAPAEKGESAGEGRERRRCERSDSERERVDEFNFSAAGERTCRSAFFPHLDLGYRRFEKTVYKWYRRFLKNRPELENSGRFFETVYTIYRRF